MLLAKHMAALIFTHEEAERSHKSESFFKKLKRLKKGILKIMKNRDRGTR